MVQCLDSKTLGGFHSSHTMITYRDVGVEKNDREEKKDIERKKKDSPTQSLKSTSFSGQICLCTRVK